MAILFRRSNGIYYLVTLHNDRRVWRSTGKRRRVDAEKYLRDIEREPGLKEAPQSKSITFMQYVQDWRTYAKTNVALSTIRSDAISSSGEIHSWGGVRFGTRLVDSRTAMVTKPPALAFRPIQRIGGDTGWYAWNWLWQLRGFLDLLAGGVGMRRGRPTTETLRVGDTVDFWRVEAFEPNRLLRLVAEMKLPGRAWLEFEIVGGNTSSTIRQTAIFDPVGLLGLMYWYALYPVHLLVFGGLLRRLVDAALSGSKTERDTPIVPDA